MDTASPQFDTEPDGPANLDPLLSEPHPSESVPPILRSAPSAVTLSNLIDDTLSIFKTAIASDLLHQHEDEVPVRSWTDEFCRFHVWSRNINGRDGTSCLDYRLSGAPHLQRQIVRLLESLQELLVDLEDNDACASEASQEDSFHDVAGELESIRKYSEVQNTFKKVVETISYLNRIADVIPIPEPSVNQVEDLTAQLDASFINSSVPATSTTIVARPMGQSNSENKKAKRISSSLLKQPRSPNSVRTGEGALHLDDMISRLLHLGRSGEVSTPFCLKTSEINGICSAARELLLDQPALLELSAPIEIVGDIHGQYGSLLRIFDNCGFPPATDYLFLGSYVNRGGQGLETLLLLLCYKLKYPENIFLLRGSHDCESLCHTHGFFDECKKRCGVKVWKAFVDVFNCLPFASIIDSKIFCVHGGLSPSLSDLDDIRNIARPTEVPHSGLTTDLLWSDPAFMEKDWTPNERGVGYYFNTNVVHHFLHQHDFELICRGNQVVEDGYEFFGDRELVTLFSAPNYLGVFDNSGAVMRVESDLLCSFQVLKPINTATPRKKHTPKDQTEQS